MNFNPNAVERKDMCDFDDPRGLFVRAEDYDLLLLEYHRLQQAFAESIESRSCGVDNHSYWAV